MFTTSTACAPDDKLLKCIKCSKTGLGNCDQIGGTGRFSDLRSYILAFLSPIQSVNNGGNTKGLTVYGCVGFFYQTAHMLLKKYSKNYLHKVESFNYLYDVIAQDCVYLLDF